MIYKAAFFDRGYEGEKEWDIHSLYEMAEFAMRAENSWASRR